MTEMSDERGMKLSIGTSDEDGWVNGSHPFYIHCVVFSLSEARENSNRKSLDDLFGSLIFEGRCPMIEPFAKNNDIARDKRVASVPINFANARDLRLAFEAFWRKHRELVSMASDSAGQLHRGPFGEGRDPFSWPMDGKGVPQSVVDIELASVRRAGEVEIVSSSSLSRNRSGVDER
jgi:hypothetical protein